MACRAQLTLACSVLHNSKKPQSKIKKTREGPIHKRHKTIVDQLTDPPSSATSSILRFAPKNPQLSRFIVSTGEKPSNAAPPMASATAAGDASAAAFWTACPHCCYVHSYPRHYAGRRLRCPTAACRRAFSAAELPAAPPIVPGTDMYFCTWAFFPLGPPAAAADGWAPFTPFNSAPTPSPPPATAAAPAPAPARAGGPTSRKKMCVSLKGRARVEAEQEEEEEEAAAAATIIDLEPEVQEGGIGEKGFTGINLNESVELSELGFRDDEIELFTAMS